MRDTLSDDLHSRAGTLNTQAGGEYRHFIARSMKENSVRISDLWLARLENVVNESTRDIFPTDQYLDHIPSMIDEIGKILEFPDEDLALANSLIERKADQLGTLRHQQRATVNQLLREYDLLSKVLEEFIVEESMKYERTVDAASSIQLMASVARIVRSILQSTVDSFVERYMATIKEQTDKILSFNTFVSHELKTPLQAAQLNMELLMETKDMTTDDARELLMIQTSMQQASSLLRNIENLIQNSDVPVVDNPTQQEIELSALIRDIAHQLDETMESRDVKMHIDDNLGELTADTAKIKLVFTNLLTNSIKYSNPDEEQRSVWIESAESDRTDVISLVVRDNGLGIDEHMRDAVFKLRVRAHEAQDEQLEITGYGMGLYLVSEALRDLGGNITLESEVGTGTILTLTLPKTPPSSRIDQNSPTVE